MYLPRDLISHLYVHLRRTTTAQSPPVLILVSLEPDALCACHILTALLRRDYIQHHIHPVSGYGDLEQAGLAQIHPMRLQNGGSGGTVICLGVGGMVDLAEVLRLEPTTVDEDPFGGVEIWIVDARRPWHLNNVFGGRPPDNAVRDVNGDFKDLSPEVTFGRVNQSYRPGKGGIIIYDDGDIEEELDGERHAFFELEAMPEVEDDGEDIGESDADSEGETGLQKPRSSKKRKSSSDAEEDDDSDGNDEEGRRRRKRRRSPNGTMSPSSPTPSRTHNLSSDDTLTNGFHSRSQSPSLPPSAAQPSPASLRRRLLRMRRKHTSVIDNYFSLGTSYSEPISSILYSLASALGREENEYLWDAIVGVSSLELYGRAITGADEPSHSRNGNPTAASPWHGADKYERIKAILRDEVRRLNPPSPAELHAEAMESATGVIPTTGRSPTDTSIRLSPEPRVLLLRHWSLYESMMHSPYLSTHLLVWTPVGAKRVGKLLAKMGISIRQSKQNYTHMDMDLKKTMRQQLLKYCPQYNLEGLVPPVVRGGGQREGWGFVRSWGWKACLSAIDVATVLGAILEVGRASATIKGPVVNGERSGRGTRNEVEDPGGERDAEEFVGRFWKAYDALGNVDKIQAAIPLAQTLHRSILRTGSALLEKHQIRHLRAFRFAVVKDGPDVALFTHPSTLLKLALWLGEAIAVQNGEYALRKGTHAADKGVTPLVMAALNERRGVFTVVGTGGGGTIHGGGGMGVDREREKERAGRRRRREERRVGRERAREERRGEKERRKARRREEHPDDDASETESEEEEEEDDESDDSDSESTRSLSPDRQAAATRRAFGKNRFGIAFQEVVDQTNARVRIDSFENCVVEVKREDLKPFLEALSEKAVVGR